MKNFLEVCHISCKKYLAWSTTFSCICQRRNCTIVNRHVYMKLGDSRRNSFCVGGYLIAGIRIDWSGCIIHRPSRILSRIRRKKKGEREDSYFPGSEILAMRRCNAGTGITKFRRKDALFALWFIHAFSSFDASSFVRG